MAGGGKILGLVILFMLSVGALAGVAYGVMSFVDVKGPEDDRRPVLRQAGKALALGGDGVELLKVLGGTDCVAKEEGKPEQWVFRLREDKAADRAPTCVPNTGDLVVWVEQRRIVAFEPVHAESEVIKDAEGFGRYQRRYARDPVETEGPIDLLTDLVPE